MRLLAAVFALLLGAAPAWACQSPIGAQYISNNKVGFDLLSEPESIPVNAPFKLLLKFCYWFPEKIDVSAHMPAHRHGTNYRPVVKRTSAGWFEVEGLLFHMPGEWEIVFDIYEGWQRERLTHRVTLQ